MSSAARAADGGWGLCRQCTFCLFLLQQGRQASHGDNDDNMSGLAAEPRDGDPTVMSSTRKTHPRAIF
eukprot:11041604-Prorocentrum_lima.AAC.1